MRLVLFGYDQSIIILCTVMIIFACRPLHEIAFSSDDKPKLLNQVPVIVQN